MVLYIILLVLSAVIPCVVNIIISPYTHNYEIWYCIVAPVAIFAIIFTLDAIIAAIIHKINPKHFSYQKKCYTVSKKEKKFLEKIGIKKWKDKVPETGQVCNFKKDKLVSTDVDYLEKFIVETCYAETIHIAMSLIGFLIFIIWPIKDFLYFTLPMSLFNFFINIPSILIQRYNRPRLVSLYKYSLRDVERNKKEELEAN